MAASTAVREAAPRPVERVEQQEREVGAQGLVDRHGQARPAGVEPGEKPGERRAGPFRLGPRVEGQVCVLTRGVGVDLRHQKAGRVLRNQQHDRALVAMGVDPRQPDHVARRSDRDEIGAGLGHSAAQAGKTVVEDTHRVVPSMSAFGRPHRGGRPEVLAVAPYSVLSTRR
jgi:hypothetical protein